MAIDIQSLANNPIVTLAGLALAAVSIVLAVIFYARSKKERWPCFEVKSNTIISGLNKALDGLQLQYNGNTQERITVTKISFWNAGLETIDKSDLVELDPLAVTCSSSLPILDFQILQSSAESNSVKIDEPYIKNDLQILPITFDYLDNNDFFVIQIVHTGDEADEFVIRGKIKGVKEIENTTFEGVGKEGELLIFLFQKYIEFIKVIRAFRNQSILGDTYGYWGSYSF